MKSNENQPEPAKERYIISMIAVLHLCHDIFFGFVSILMPVVKARFGLSYFAVSLMKVIPRISSFFNPLIAALVEHRQMRLLIASTPAVTAASICLVGLSPSYYMVLTLLLVAGLSSALFHVPMPVLLRRAAPDKTGVGMSLYQFGGESARAIGPILAPLAILYLGAEYLFLLIPFSILTSIMLYRLLGNIQVSTKPREHAAFAAITATLREQPRLFVCILGIMLQKAFTATMLTTYLVLYLHEKTNSLVNAGNGLALLQFGAMVGVLMFGTLSDRLGRRQTIIFLTVSCPLCMLLLCYSVAMSLVFYLSLMLLGVSAFSASPVIMAIIQDQKFRYPIIANGIYTTVNFAVCAMFILVAGIIADHTNLKEMFQWFTWLSFIGVPFAFLLQKHGQSEGA